MTYHLDNLQFLLIVNVTGFHRGYRKTSYMSENLILWNAYWFHDINGLTFTSR